MSAKLLDAALGLVAAAGPRAVSMSAVARAAGAPSGSLYHRFPSRPALLAALWLRTVERFQSGFVAATADPAQRAAVAAACHVISWSRSHPQESRLLLYGPADFDEPDWPAEARHRLERLNGRVGDALRALAARLPPPGQHDLERLLLATVDLPYAVVRRHGHAREPGADGDATSVGLSVIGARSRFRPLWGRKVRSREDLGEAG